MGDIDAPAPHRIVLAGAHVGDGGADQGEAVAAAFDRLEIGLIEVEEESLALGPARRQLDGDALPLAMHLEGRSDEAVASDDQPGLLLSHRRLTGDLPSASS